MINLVGLHGKQILAVVVIFGMGTYWNHQQQLCIFNASGTHCHDMS